MTKPKRKTPEADLQIAIVEWFELAYPDHAKWLHHSPNGGKRSKSEGARFKRMGTKAGFPDLVLFHKRYSKDEIHYGMAIELKASKKEKPTEDQESWGEHLINTGFMTFLISDYYEAVALITYYMQPILPRVKL